MTVSKPTKTGAAVARDEKGRVVAGSGALNPGGLTEDERAARDAVRKLFAAVGPEGFRDAGVTAYRELLTEKNPVIVKDFMDRLLGKARERVSLEDNEGNPLPALGNATLEQILEVVRSGK